MDSSTYRQLVGKLKKSCAIPHHNFPSHNLVSLDTLKRVSENSSIDIFDAGAEFLSSFPCYQPFPYVVNRNTPLLCGSGFTDDATEMVKKKAKWEKKLKNFRLNSIEGAIQKIKKLRQEKTQNLSISKNLRQYIDHFYNDPEPKFSGKYNWLYTGGTLDYMQNHDGVTLVSADFSERKPGFYLLKLNETLDKIQYKCFSELKTYSPVFQISCRSKQNSSFICVRQKNYVSLFSLKNSECLSQPDKLWRKKVSATKLMTCIDIKGNCEEVLVSDSNQDIHVFNVEKKDKIYGFVGAKFSDGFTFDNWNQVVFGELGLYLAFRHCFLILDVRVFHSKEALNYSPFSAVNNCEELCSFVSSSGDSNFVYLGTTHGVVQIDLRKGKPVQKWTHLMKNPPQFLTIARSKEGNDVLMLQSQQVDETTAIVNECIRKEKDVYFLSRSLPCGLPNMKESLNLARFHGVCLTPAVAKRIDFAVTGMQFLKSGEEKFDLLTKNSAGDIFVKKIREKCSEFTLTKTDEEETVEDMKTYESCLENLPKKKKSVREGFDVIDMSHLVKDLKQSQAVSKTCKKPEIYWKGQEMYSPESLELYKDLLAQKILRVWGYGCDESEFEDATQSATEKVLEWINRHEN